MFTDFSQWKKKNIKTLIGYLVEIAISGHEQNRIMYCYNTILTICLSCEFLTKIGKTVSVFKHEASIAINKLLQLGCKLISNMEDHTIN